MIRSSHKRQGQENQLKGHLSVKSGANNGQCTTFFPWNASRSQLPFFFFPHSPLRTLRTIKYETYSKLTFFFRSRVSPIFVLLFFFRDSTLSASLSLSCSFCCYCFQSIRRLGSQNTNNPCTSGSADRNDGLIAFDYFSLPASTFPHNLNGRETPPKRSTTYRPTSNYIYLPTHCPPTYLSSTSNAAVTERKAVEFEKQKRRFSPIFSPHLSSARNSVRLVPPATTRLCQGHGTWGCRRTKLLSIIIPIWQLFLGWDLVLFL